MQFLSILCLTFSCLLQQQQMCDGCYIPEGSDWKTIATLYYMDSPYVYEGYATNAGSERVMINALRWHAKELIAQKNHGSGYILIGGGYGFVEINGEEHLIQNRASYGYTLMQKYKIPTYMNYKQQRLYKIGMMSDEEYSNYVKNNFDGVIATKSPNDMGRVFKLYVKQGSDYKYLGIYIVGDCAASNDWMPQGSSLNDFYGHDRLGYRLGEKDGITYPWVVDVTNLSFNKAQSYSEGLVIIKLEEMHTDVLYFREDVLRVPRFNPIHN